jgi:hypothetical protein
MTWLIAAALLAGAACGFVLGFWTCAMLLEN